MSVMVKINIRKNERKGYQIDMDTVPAFPVRDMPIALHFAPVQLSRKIGYHCPGEHGLSGKFFYTGRKTSRAGRASPEGAAGRGRGTPGAATTARLSQRTSWDFLVHCLQQSNSIISTHCNEIGG